MKEVELIADSKLTQVQLKDLNPIQYAIWWYSEGNKSILIPLDTSLQLFGWINTRTGILSKPNFTSVQEAIYYMKTKFGTVKVFKH